MKKIKDGVSASENDSEGEIFKKKGNKRTIAEEEQQLKQEFKKLAQDSESEEFVLKKKSKVDSEDDEPV